MYQKRSAWVLTGVAPFRPEGASARPRSPTSSWPCRPEIPLVKQHLCDVLWAVASGGAHAERFNRLTGERRPLPFAPSRAQTIAQGYGGLSRFFPGARAELAAIDDAVVTRLLGPSEKGRARAFEDQYISSGGQLYELMVGHDRWIGDLRPLVEPVLRARGEALGLCAHPYDLSTELIAREAGVIVTDEAGGGSTRRSTSSPSSPGSGTRTRRSAPRWSRRSGRRWANGGSRRHDASAAHAVAPRGGFEGEPSPRDRSSGGPSPGSPPGLTSSIRIGRSCWRARRAVST